MSEPKIASLRDMLCSFPEAGEIFSGFDRHTIVEEAKAGRLTTVRIGKRDYLHRIEVERRRDEILAALRAPTPATTPAATIAPADPIIAERLLVADCAAPAATD
jgi:hypothetical protein